MKKPETNAEALNRLAKQARKFRDSHTHPSPMWHYYEGMNTAYIAAVMRLRKHG
jgi:hypothetical protein